MLDVIQVYGVRIFRTAYFFEVEVFAVRLSERECDGGKVTVFGVRPRDDGDVKRDGRLARVLRKPSFEERADVYGRAEEALRSVLSSGGHREALRGELFYVFPRDSPYKYLAACSTAELSTLNFIILDALKSRRVQEHVKEVLLGLK